MTSVRVTRGSAGALALAGLVGILAFTWPLFARPAEGADFATQVPFLFAGILLLVLTVLAAELGGAAMDVRALALLGVLAAIGSALRPLGGGTAGLETVFFLLILGGRVFGPGFGFALGTTTLFASALLTGGVGPWLPHQMLAAGFVGLGAGLLPGARARILRGRLEIVLLAAYGTVAAFAYGWLMDLSFWPFTLGVAGPLAWDPTAAPAENLQRFVLYNLATSMGWNVGRAVTTALLLALLGPGLLLVLRRAARRANFESGALEVDRAQHLGPAAVKSPAP